MPPRLLTLMQELRQISPQLAMDLRLLPSGVAFLNVYSGGRDMVLEYHPTDGTGVSENTDSTPPFHVGHDEVFPSIELGADRLVQLVRKLLTTPRTHAA